VRRNTQTKELGPKRKTNASSTTSNSMVKAVGDPSPKLLVNYIYSSSFFNINYSSTYTKSNQNKKCTFFPSFTLTPFLITGLLRCGKSCRLRWINYLRPDLKRGNFTEDEDELIINLHSLLGNKYEHNPKTPFLFFPISHCHIIHPKKKINFYLFFLSKTIISISPIKISHFYFLFLFFLSDGL